MRGGRTWMRGRAAFLPAALCAAVWAWGVAAAFVRAGAPAGQAPPAGEVVQAAWEAVSRLYFDARMGGKDWGAIRDRYLEMASRPGADGYLLAARMLQELGAQSGVIFTPDQARQLRESSVRESLVGVGVVIVQTQAGEVLVRTVLPGGPADRGGVRRGERIAAVDGVATAGRSLDEVAASIRGRPGTKVTLQLIGPEGESRQLTLTRQPYTFEPKIQTRVLADNVGYLYLPHFQPGMETAFLGEIRKLYRTRALVLDLRDSASSAGGSLLTLSHIAGLVMQEPLGLLASRQGVTLVPARRAEESDNPLIPAPTDLDFYAKPMVVLIDETSRFYELAFALKENGRAVLVGRPTASGGGQLQTCEGLPGGGQICVTSMRFFSAKGQPLVGPVVPNVVVPLDEAFLKRWAEGGDLDVEKALEVIRRQSQGA